MPAIAAAETIAAIYCDALRTIAGELPRSSLEDVTRELLRRAGVRVNPVTVRKAGIGRLKSLHRAAATAPAA